MDQVLPRLGVFIIVIHLENLHLIYCNEGEGRVLVILDSISISEYSSQPSQAVFLVKIFFEGVN